MRDKDYWKEEINNMRMMEYSSLLRAITEHNQEMIDNAMVDNL